MKFVFVKANTFGSRLIRWGTSEPASHVAVIFQNPTRFFHSYLTGIHEEHIDYASSHYQVVGEINISTTPEEEKALLESFLKNVPPNNYDYPGLLYFGYRALLNKVFATPFPRLNAWQTPDAFLCTEITYVVATAITEVLALNILPDGFDYAMVKPWSLYNLLVRRIQACRFQKFSYASFLS